ncbi:RNA methyltransferase [Cellulophaga sp. HaHaR_3_176]|uniref:TrmH family RNA methyltransferase n=1 Tax=Cellulophaga sp. HaHaR_3_176 TaxID=1942464 RepID=UPI001C1FC33D|nr:RNA methyltransferase [Cellulophaga sp. HaHaR_3_176]QWX82504.1 RNA methyltransferase [Cellulophaga sp. HaHaR_3_176]
MNAIKQISSLQNSLIKSVLVLKDKSRERKKTGEFVLEGSREFQLALKGKYTIKTLFFNEAIVTEKEILELLKNLKHSPELIKVSKEVYQKIAYRETTEGIIAIAKAKSHLLSDLKFNTKNPLILIAEATEKPGNIGALLRTADAAKLDAVLIANPKGDLYNPNIIRSSIGCVFTNNVAMGSTEEIISFLKDNDIAIYCAALTASENYTKIDYSKPSAIVVGTEATGLSNEWLDNSTQNIIIPMEGEIDSMNVSVSAAIVIFEAKRQRAL